MVVNEIHGNVLMRMLSVTYNTHTSRIIYRCCMSVHIVHASHWSMYLSFHLVVCVTYVFFEQLNNLCDNNFNRVYS